MIQMQTHLKVADDTGAKELICIRVLGGSRKRYAEIGDAITEKLSRGATVLHGMGWYTGEKRNVVLCVLKRAELFTLQKLVREIDGNAFVIITDAAEVLGSGFNSPDKI